MFRDVIPLVLFGALILLAGISIATLLLGKPQQRQSVSPSDPTAPSRTVEARQFVDAWHAGSAGCNGRDRCISELGIAIAK